jgi:hypothetical protein
VATRRRRARKNAAHSRILRQRRGFLKAATEGRSTSGGRQAAADELRLTRARPERSGRARSATLASDRHLPGNRDPWIDVNVNGI